MKKILQLAFCMLFLFSCQNKCKECISADFFQNKKIECIVLEKEKYGNKRPYLDNFLSYMPVYILTLKTNDTIFKIDTNYFENLYEIEKSKIGETIIIKNKEVKRKRVNGSWGKVVDRYKRESPEEFILVIKFPDTLMTVNDKKMYYDWGNIGEFIFRLENGELKNTDVLFEINEQNSKNGRY